MAAAQKSSSVSQQVVASGERRAEEVEDAEGSAKTRKEAEEKDGQKLALERQIAQLKETIAELRVTIVKTEEANRADLEDAVRWRTFSAAVRFKGTCVDDRTTYLHDADYSLTVDKYSPLNWDKECAECAKKPRLMKDVWRDCPKRFEEHSFKTLREYALLRTFIEKWGAKLTLERAKRVMESERSKEKMQILDHIVEETIANLCEHSLPSLRGPTPNNASRRFFLPAINPIYDRPYRRGLGENVDLSIGYGGCLHRGGVGITTVGGDTARWEWREAEVSDWDKILEEWDRRYIAKRALLKILIFWPRSLSLARALALKNVIMELTARNCWRTTVVMEPCAHATDNFYSTFLMEWASEKPTRGCIRIISHDGAATTDGTPVSALQLCHPWMRKDHWEFAVEAWTHGYRWDPREAKRQLVEKGFARAEEKTEAQKKAGSVDDSASVKRKVPEEDAVPADNMENSLSQPAKEGPNEGMCSKGASSSAEQPDTMRKDGEGSGHNATKETGESSQKRAKTTDNASVIE